jgi:hypothetical protein
MRYLIAVVLMLGLSGCLQERTGVSQTDVPTPVLRTIEKAAPGKVNSIVRETKDGRTTYRADVTSREQRWEVTVAGDGELVSKKEWQNWH